MKITFEEQGEEVVFRVSDFDPKYANVLRKTFYTQEGESYTKRFPQSARYLDKIKAYYAAHAPQMFDQIGYFAPIPWEQALHEFAGIMAAHRIDWWLTGSCAVCIRGIPLEPHDIDAMIDSADVDRVAEVFQDYLIEPIVDTGGWVTKDFGVVFRHAMIDIASDPAASLDDPEPADCGPYAREHLEVVEWRGLVIKVPPLRLSLAVNKRRGRTERALAIEEYLSKTGDEEPEG
jgi:hypothetical protein